MAKDDSFDLAVVGAGPGGLQAALRSTARGLRVVLLERQNEIGYPIQTSGGSYFEDLHALGVPDRYLHPLDAVVFASTNRTVEVRYPTATACVMDIRGAYQHLAMEAARKGCRIWVKSNVKEPVISPSGRVTGLSLDPGSPTERVSSRFVIDASGITGVTLRPTGLAPQGPSRFGVGVEYEAFVEHPDPTRAYLLMSSRFAPSGYAWVFPCTKDRARIGVGILKPDSNVSPVKLLGQLMASQHELIKSLGRIEPIEYHGGSIPVEPIPQRATFPGLLAIGDAARQANPVVGEGIRQAMSFGRLAGETVAEVINEEATEDEAIRKFESAVASHASSLGAALELNRAMATYDDAHWDDLVGLVGAIQPREVLSILRGELSRTFLAKLLVKHPRFLASRTIRSLRDSRAT